MRTKNPNLQYKDIAQLATRAEQELQQHHLCPSTSLEYTTQFRDLMDQIPLTPELTHLSAGLFPYHLLIESIEAAEGKAQDYVAELGETSIRITDFQNTLQHLCENPTEVLQDQQVKNKITRVLTGFSRRITEQQNSNPKWR